MGADVLRPLSANRVGGGRGSFVEEDEEELKKKPRAGDDDGRAPVG